MEPFQIYILVVIYFSFTAATFLMLNFLKNYKKLISNKKIPPKNQKVSIIIPAYNEEKNIQTLLTSIYNLDYPKNNIEVILVDDGSTDNTAQKANQFKKNHKDIEISILKKQNGGKAQAINHGIKHSKHPLILTIDSDCLMAKDSLKNMLPYLDNKQVTSVIPTAKVLYKNTFLEKMQNIEYLLAVFAKKLMTFSRALHITPGCALYKKTFFENFGGLDEKNLTEDLEIGLRIQSKGFLVEHAHEATIYTKTPSNFKQLLKQRIRWDYGTFDNILIKYRYMISAKYAELGTFVLPLVLLTTLLMALSFIFFTTQFIINWIKGGKNLLLINFDIIYTLTNKKFYYLLSPPFILTYIGFLIGIIFFILAKKYLKEKTPPFHHYLGYIFIYIWLLLFFKFYSIIRFIFKKRPDW